MSSCRPVVVSVLKDLSLVDAKGRYALLSAPHFSVLERTSARKPPAALYFNLVLHTEPLWQLIYRYQTRMLFYCLRCHVHDSATCHCCLPQLVQQYSSIDMTVHTTCGLSMPMDVGSVGVLPRKTAKHDIFCCVGGLHSGSWFMARLAAARTEIYVTRMIAATIKYQYLSLSKTKDSQPRGSCTFSALAPTKREASFACLVRDI